ncbi:glutathione transferase GstA [Pantoea vagans]|uniref:glutathione transferase GstA n=1 Tax=Pantoea vagans TaxID=470934 RepID=UPI0023B01463|nr:glutathione transferase GstA [Pantoea vagans]MDE8557616.1 glutathione transferase GstA [Pantoea vagans]MDE8577184.1 glutathione transferase GstA [Pantoea vagans]
MKLYYAPYTCSLAPHIVLRELAMEFELSRVNNRSKLTADGRDFRLINPKGYVAALELDDGQKLTEGPAIADLTPQSGLAPPAGSWQRVRLQEWLNFISSEIHAGSALLFDTALQDAVLAIVREKLFKRFDYLQEVLADKTYLMGASFSVADAYLFTVLGWCKYFNIELDRWSALVAYRAAINTRPAVQAALLAETMQ